MLCNIKCSNCNSIGNGDFVCAYNMTCTIENYKPKDCPCPEQNDSEEEEDDECLLHYCVR